MALSLVLSTTAAMAAESLIGIEGSYGKMSVDTERSNVATNDKVTLEGGGVKIGAQNDEFRLFLNANYYGSTNDHYNHVETYGVELDYLMKPATSFDIYIGVNGGMANIEQIDDLNLKRTSSDPYYGASLGVNMHVSKLIDLELGGRMLFLDISNTRNNVKYTYNSIASAYASVIFKFNMEE